MSIEPEKMWRVWWGALCWWGDWGPGPLPPLNPALLVPHLYVGSYEDRVRSASNITVITRNLPRKLRVGKIENYP